MDMQPMQLSGNTLVFSNSVEGYSVDFVSPQSYETGPFAIVDGEVVNWWCVCGRTTVAKANGKKKIEGAKQVYLKIKHPKGGKAFDIDVVTSKDGTNSDTVTYFQLYELDDDGMVTVDYRSHALIFPFYN